MSMPSNLMDMETLASEDQRPSFFSLPFEIRCIIYSYAFAPFLTTAHVRRKSLGPASLESTSHTSTTWQIRESKPPLSVSRLFYAEALPYLDLVRYWSFVSGCDMFSWLKAIGHIRRRSIEAVTIPYYDHSPPLAGYGNLNPGLKDAVHVLNHHCPRLERVRFYVYDYDFMFQGHGNHNSNSVAHSLRGLKIVDLIRHYYRETDRVDSRESRECTSHWEQVRLNMMQPSTEACYRYRDLWWNRFCPLSQNDPETACPCTGNSRRC